MILAIAEEDKQRTAGLVQLSMIQFRKKLARQVPDFYRGVSSEQQIQLCFRQHQTKKKLGKILNMAPAQVSITSDCLLDVRMESIYSI